MTVVELETVPPALHAAARVLETARRGRGARLLVEYRSALESIERFPALYPLVADPLPSRECRNALLGRLPYLVVYEVRPDEVLVVALIHTSRRDGVWHSWVPTT